MIAFRGVWEHAGKMMIHGSIQDPSAVRYARTFAKWTYFLSLTGRFDPYLTYAPNVEVITVISAYAAWARAPGTWSGITTMQSLAHIKHHWLVNVRDTSMFSSPSIKKLRTSLKLTDRFDESRQNRKKRLLFGPDMVETTASDAVNAADPTIIMTAAGIVMASLALMRISEYGQAPTQLIDPDHRIYSKNVTFNVDGRAHPLTPTELREYARASATPVHKRISSVSILIVGSKTDKVGDGTMLTFCAKDFDLENPTNAISVWSRWACLVEHADNEPFFAYRDESGALVELTAKLVTRELRRVAKIHGFPDDQLYRFTPHSIRVGMASHLHNLGVTSTVILQMGRWSPTSNAAQLYQRLGLGACSIVAKSTRASVVKTAHSSADTLRTLVRREGYNDQYLARHRLREAAKAGKTDTKARKAAAKAEKASAKAEKAAAKTENAAAKKAAKAAGKVVKPTRDR